MLPLRSLTAAVLLFTCVSLALTAGSSARASADTSEAPAASGYAHRFVAAPDFLNQDVGDIRTLPTYEPGDSNSWTPQLQRSIDRFLDAIAAERPQSVLVTGDLVEGHWLRDIDETGIFGPSDTPAQVSQMVRSAGDFYEGLWAERFRERGLTFHAAVGDHDIGDNPWRGNRENEAKRANGDVFRDVFADNINTAPDGTLRYDEHPVGTPYDRTAYATHLAPEVLLVTVDVFNTRGGDVHSEVVGGQLAWLKRVLDRAQTDGIDWVIVQGHDPVIPRVRTRSSSGMLLEQGTDSRFWRAMIDGGVDLYLSGEVHDTSSALDGGVLQIATGGLLWAGFPTYMTIDATPGRLSFTVKEFASKMVGDPGPIWQLATYRTGGGRVITKSDVVGTLTLEADGMISSSSGKLTPLE